MWATRYLAPVILFMPLALAPFFGKFRAKWRPLFLVPYLLVAAVGRKRTRPLFRSHVGDPLPGSGDPLHAARARAVFRQVPREVAAAFPRPLPPRGRGRSEAHTTALPISCGRPVTWLR